MSEEQNLSNKLKELEERKQRLVAEEHIYMRKALESDDPDAFIKASNFAQGVQNKGKANSKSYFLDPTALNARDGYLSAPNKVTDAVLRNMAKAPIIKAIIETRVEQVADFSVPQKDKYSTGFVIRKKGKYYKGDNEEKVTKQDENRIQVLTEFMLNCGADNNKWHGDDFNSWLRKITKDSLVLDRVTSEIVRNNKGFPVEFVATDAATFRLADTFDDNKTPFKDGQNLSMGNRTKKEGHFPSFVQIYQGQIIADFYPWELMWGIRNPQTNIYTNGYGESELETLIQTVTAMLQGDVYNANVFKVGAVPAGIFKVSGSINENRLQEFRQQWGATMSGYQSAHKTAFLEADKMEFVDLSKSNRDMEYSKYQEYLIKLACSIYKISPEEIGFSIQQSSESASMFEGNNEAKLKYSKDKGLKPLLKFIEGLINKYIISPIDAEYEFAFVGLDAETEEKELEMAIKKAGSFKGLKEIRRERGLPDEIDEDDVILNPVWIQAQQMKQMGGQDSNDFIDQLTAEEENPMAKSFNEFVDKELLTK